MLDMHVHLVGHDDGDAKLKTSEETIRSYLKVASQLGLREIGFADHDYFWDQMDLPLIREVAQEYPDLAVRIGIEAEYRPEDEGRIKHLLEQYPFDFVIGSIHEVDGWIFDIPEEEPSHWKRDVDEFYRDYFRVVTQAAKSGLFTTIGHFDIIKLYGARPTSDILGIADEALTTVSEHGLVLEVNTNGRYKPVQEFYPEQRLIEEIHRRGIDFTIGSDAHCAKFVGRDIKVATRILRGVGVNTVVGFEKLEKLSFPLV